MKPSSLSRATSSTSYIPTQTILVHFFMGNRFPARYSANLCERFGHFTLSPDASRRLLIVIKFQDDPLLKSAFFVWSGIRTNALHRYVRICAKVAFTLPNNSPGVHRRHTRITRCHSLRMAYKYFCSQIRRGAQIY